MDKAKTYRENAHAVIIGINTYQDPKIQDLRYACADAQGVYDVLTDPELGRFSPENVTLLLDGEATRRNISTEIGTKMRRRAGEKDLVYVYYAGHGSAEIDPKCQYRDGVEKYLVPSDAELDDLFSTGIAMEEIQKYFRRIESKQVIFFIDSCYSGEAGGRTFQNPNYQKRAALTDEFLTDLAGEGRVIVAACDVREVSLETPDLGHGLFTHHLIEGLKGGADRDSDGLVTINELYDYVYENVSEQARRMGGSMHPIQKGSIRGKIFLTQYETEEQKKAKQLMAEAEKLNTQAKDAYQNGNIDEAYKHWYNVLDIQPENEEAKNGIATVERERHEEQEKKRNILERRQAVLLHHYQNGKLTIEEYTRGMALLEKDELDDRERKIQKLLFDFTDNKTTTAIYLTSVTLLEKGIVTDLPSGEDRKEVVTKEDEKINVQEKIETTHHERSEETSARETLKEKKTEELEEFDKRSEKEKQLKADQEVIKPGISAKRNKLIWLLPGTIVPFIAGMVVLVMILINPDPIREKVLVKNRDEPKQIPIISEKKEVLEVKKSGEVEDKKAVIAKAKFRSVPRDREYLSESSVKSMLKDKGFFDSEWNKSASGFSNNYELQRNGQVVYNHASDLMWQQSGSQKYMNFDDAKKYVSQLNREGFAGFNDWRLPTLEEAMSLMEPSQKNDDLYIEKVFDKIQKWIWTSDLFSASSAWVANFNFGDCFSLDFNSFNFYVRAVR